MAQDTFLSYSNLVALEANYRAQADQAENMNGVRRAEGAAMAIRALREAAYPDPEVVTKAKPVEQNGQDKPSKAHARNA